MNDLKTTISGTLAALPQLVALIAPIIGVQGLPPEISAATTTLGLFLLGLFSKDKGNAV